jgi:hypothetical protein
MDDTTRKLLTAARAKVAAGWTQETSARRADGLAVGASDPAATCWCALGALFAAGDALAPERCDREMELRAADELKRLGGVPTSLVGWNDRRGRTQAEVVALFDRALAGQAEDADAAIDAAMSRAALQQEARR